MDRWLRNTTAVRIMALMLGILLWAVVRIVTAPADTGGTQSLVRSQEFTNVSLTTIGLDQGQFAIKQISPDKVRVRVIGREAAIRLVNPRSYQIQVNLSGIGEGEHNVALREIGFPAGVEVEIYPPTVSVHVERKVIKEMSVTLRTTGTPAEGYKAGQPLMKPNRVNVTVPASLEDQIAQVVGVLSVEGATNAIMKQVKLVVLDKNGREMDVAVTPGVVDVEVPITSPFKTVPLEVRLTNALPPGLAIAGYRQTPDKVTVYGAQTLLDRLEFYAGPEIDLSKVKETGKLTLDIPLRERLRQVEPAKVEVELQLAPALTKQLESVPVTVSGQNDDYVTRLLTPETGRVSLTLEGAANVLETVTAAKVQAIANVSNLPPGIHEVVLDFNLPGFVRVVQPGFPRVRIEITAKPKPAAPAPAAGGGATSGANGAGGGAAGGGTTGGGPAAVPPAGAAPGPAGNTGP